MPKTIFDNRDSCYMVLVNGVNQVVTGLSLMAFCSLKEGKVTLAVSFSFFSLQF